MRKAGRVVALFVLSLLSTAALGVITAVMAAVSLAATALIVPGTGDPDPAPDSLYVEHTLRYLSPFSGCENDTQCDLTPIPYSASFFPLVIFPGWCDPGRCDTWNASVQTGVDGLHTALVNTPSSPENPIVVFGYSQGGAVVSNELRAIADNPVLLGKISSIVMIGNAYNPDGGLFTRLGFLPTIPFLDITFGPATPTDTGIPMTGIGFEYDPVMYAPLYWGNPLALFNAFAAFDNVHGYYLTPDGTNNDEIAYGYTETELEAILATDCPGPHCRVDTEGNKYYMIPAKSLPMMNLIMGMVPDPLKPLVQPIIDLISPVAKVLIDLGYDWSGNPGDTRYLSILPFSPTTNWLQVGVDLVRAVGEGIENVFGGGSTMIAPADTDDVSPFNARIAATTTVNEDKDKKAVDGQHVDVVDEVSTADSLDSTTPETTPGTTPTPQDETAVEPADAAKAEREAAKAERQAAREAKKAEREAAREAKKAAREAAKAERDAAHEAAKAQPGTANAETEPATPAPASDSGTDAASGQAAA